MEARRAQAKESGHVLHIKFAWNCRYRELHRRFNEPWKNAAEDASFFAHEGFDWEGIKDAALYNLEVGSSNGGSTITQQLAKNLYLSSERSGYEKAREALDHTFPGTPFLTRNKFWRAYLNVAEWGLGRVGAEAAATPFPGNGGGPDDRGCGLARRDPSPRRYDPIRHTAWPESTPAASCAG